jgi:hypothetical protein
MPGGRPSTLTAEMVAAAAEVARTAPTLRAIGAAIGVRPGTVRDWIRKGESEDAPPLHAEFAVAIHGALAEAETALVLKIATGEPRDAAWLLTHSPFFRDDWSDAAAARRAVAASQARTVAVIEAAAGLTPEQRYRLLLELAAAGQAEMPDRGES